MKKARGVFARMGALAISLTLAASLFPITAFATSGSHDVTDTDSKNWNNQTRYNVAAPVALVFGSDGNGYDVNDKSGSVTATGTFKNYASPVRLSAVDYMSYNDDTSSKKAFSNLDGTSIDVIDVFGSTKSVNVGLNRHVTTENNSQSGIGGFIINGSSTASATNPSMTDMQFKLNFRQDVNSNNLNVNKSAADAGETAYPFGKIRYTFDTKIADFFLIDIRDGRYDIYDLPTVKQHAIDIAKGVTTSVSDQRTESAEAMYTAFTTYPAVKNSSDQIVSRDGKQNYICKVYLGKPYYDYYDLNIIGVNQDTLDLSILPPDQLNASKDATSDGRKKAGITFMFDKVIAEGVFATGMEGDVLNNGWGATLENGNQRVNCILRQAMNPTFNTDTEPDQTVSYYQSYKDYKKYYEAIYNAFGKSDIKQVQKTSGLSTRNSRTCVYYPGTTISTSDKLFIASTRELGVTEGVPMWVMYGNGNGLFNTHSDIVNNSWYSMFSGWDGFGTNKDQPYMYYGAEGLNVKELPRWFWSNGNNHYTMYPDATSSPKFVKYDLEGNAKQWWTRSQNGESAVTTVTILDKSLGNTMADSDRSALLKLSSTTQGVVPCFCL